MVSEAPGNLARSPMRSERRHLAAEMRFRSLFRQTRLFLAFGETPALFRRCPVMTVRTTDARDIVLAALFFCRHRMAASMALAVAARFEVMIDGYALIEHETLAAPKAVLR